MSAWSARFRLTRSRLRDVPGNSALQLPGVSGQTLEGTHEERGGEPLHDTE
ncbi:hypothetical protein JW916_01845 [Candidatus Sumerlaeota bacterium]|nr:hypothetical protein [Candidatus Sumerlaeota bacterium]